MSMSMSKKSASSAAAASASGRRRDIRRLPARRRAAVLSASLRSREQMRRVLRQLGYAPLIFADLDEFLEAGCGSPRALDMLLLGDVPEQSAWGDWGQARRLLGIDARLPLLHAPMRRQPRPPARGSADARTMLAAPRYYGELHETVLRFLRQYGFETAPRALRWGRYAFDPAAMAVSFDERQVSLDPVAFDLALEFFNHAGRTLGPAWLRCMLPADERGANWHRIDNLACTVDDLRYALQLDAADGWRLDGTEQEGFGLRPPSAVPAPA